MNIMEFAPGTNRADMPPLPPHLMKTGERRTPKPGEMYLAKNGRVHKHTGMPGLIIWGDFEIVVEREA